MEINNIRKTGLKMTVSLSLMTIAFVLLILPTTGLVLDAPAMFGSKSYAEVYGPHIGLIVYGLALSAFFCSYCNDSSNSERDNYSKLDI